MQIKSVPHKSEYLFTRSGCRSHTNLNLFLGEVVANQHVTRVPTPKRRQNILDQRTTLAPLFFACCTICCELGKHATRTRRAQAHLHFQILAVVMLKARPTRGLPKIHVVALAIFGMLVICSIFSNLSRSMNFSDRMTLPADEGDSVASLESSKSVPSMTDLFHLYYSNVKDVNNTKRLCDLDHMGPNPGVHQQD